MTISIDMEGELLTRVICSRLFQVNHHKLRNLTRDIALNCKRMPKETIRDLGSKRDTKIEEKLKVAVDGVRYKE